MKKFIEKFLSKKRNVAILVILVIAIFAIGNYVVTGVITNVQQMTSDNTSVTYYPAYPPVDTRGKDPSLIKRGEYLAKAGDCIACHTNTPDKGPTFAGGLPMATPFGTIYSPNITPDKETGIGSWTEDDFIKAMRKGVSPHGYYYYPAFPYLYFNRISTDDLKALKAYLDSIPAVKQTNLKNEMVWPFNQRLLQLPWRILFFHPGKDNEAMAPQIGSLPAATQNDILKRGEYLVEGLGHCAMCHSPSYHIFSPELSLGAPIRKYDLSGAKVQGFLAPNISKKDLSNVPVDEIIDVFLKDKLIGGGNVEGPMLEVNHDSLHYLSRSDLVAIATYLKSVQSATPPKPKVGKGGEGPAIYQGYCSGCHATGGGGAPKYGDVQTWTPLLEGGIPKLYANAIKGIGGMPAKGTCMSCTDTEIKQAVDYMVASVTGPAAKRAAPPPQTKLTMADGKKLYDDNCSICHNVGFKGAEKPGDIDAWKPILSQGFITTFQNVSTGRNGHPPRGACPTCSDEELVAAIKYMMQQSTTTENFNLW